MYVIVYRDHGECVLLVVCVCVLIEWIWVCFNVILVCVCVLIEIGECVLLVVWLLLMYVA